MPLATFFNHDLQRHKKVVREHLKNILTSNILFTDIQYQFICRFIDSLQFTCIRFILIVINVNSTSSLTEFMKYTVACSPVTG
jgi:hypothetical protein